MIFFIIILAGKSKCLQKIVFPWEGRSTGQMMVYIEYTDAIQIQGEEAKTEKNTVCRLSSRWLESLEQSTDFTGRSYIS